MAGGRVLFLVSLTVVCAIVAGECPNGWTRFDDSCYRIFEKNLIWPEAQFACEQENGFLAVMTSKQEIANVHALIREYNIRVSEKNNIWIGLTDVRNEGVWVWEDTKLTAKEYDWANGEPNSANGNEDCVEIWTKGEFKWADVQCSKLQHYLCERRLITPVD